MKMRQLATKVGGIVRCVFTDTIFLNTIIFEGKITKPKCNKDVISGIRETSVEDFTKCMNIKRRELNILKKKIIVLNLLHLNILRNLK
jgi:hypothetical protein